MSHIEASAMTNSLAGSGLPLPTQADSGIVIVIAIVRQLCCNRDKIAELMRYSQVVPVWLLCLAAGVTALFVHRSHRLSIGSAAPIRLWLRIALMMTLTACCGCTGSHNPASQTVRSQDTAFQNAGSENFEARFPFHQQTTYFDFRLQSESPQNARTIRLSDNFVDIVKRDFFNADRGYPIRVFICQDEGKFVRFMHRDLEIQDPSDFGIYLFSKKLLATYEDSGLGTFAHEALHPLVEENLPQRPAWAVEGVPTFFEKFYGYWNGGQLVLYWGFQNPWRMRELGPELTQLDLKRIVSENGRPEQSESKLRMAAMFLWEQGKLRRFLRLVAANNRLGYATYFEAAMGMSMGKITPIWQSYLENIERNRAEMLSLPPSTVLRNEAEFQAFVKTHSISLKQIKQIN
jgi:hypothetical protein